MSECQSEEVFQIGERSFGCPVELGLSVIEGKWKSLIVWHLRVGTLRYSELHRRLPRITHKMLAQQLRELERDGLLDRKVYPVVPPRVEYTLTAPGFRMLTVLEALGQWGFAYRAVSTEVGIEGAV